MISPEAIKQARKTNLHDWLVKNPIIEYKKEGTKSLRITGGLNVYGCGYKDFSSGEHGNAVDFLIRYCNYNFKEAISALTNNELQPQKTFSSRKEISSAKKITDFSFPSPHTDQKRVFGYLCARGITPNIIKNLIKNELLYEDVKHNCIFISKKKDMYEARGTLSEKPFHTSRRRYSGRYWLLGVESPSVIYICESSIDAISLYQLHTQNGGGGKEKLAYVSMASVANADACLQAISFDYSNVNIVIATDADAAGDAVREKYPKYRSIRPSGGRKDWNNYLQH